MKKLLGALVLLGVVFSPLAAEARYVRFRKNQNSYVAGERAIIFTRLVTRPLNSDMAFYLDGEWDGQPLVLSPITDEESFVKTPPLVSGEHEFRVRVYLENKLLASNLKTSITHYAAEIERINGLLAEATDAEVIAALEAEKAENETLKAACENQLSSHRRLLDGQASITIQVL